MARFWEILCLTWLPWRAQQNRWCPCQMWGQESESGESCCRVLLWEMFWPLLTFSSDRANCIVNRTNTYSELISPAGQRGGCGSPITDDVWQIMVTIANQCPRRPPTPPQTGHNQQPATRESETKGRLKLKLSLPDSYLFAACTKGAKLMLIHLRLQLFAFQLNIFTQILKQSTAFSHSGSVQHRIIIRIQDPDPHSDCLHEIISLSAVYYSVYLRLSLHSM